METNNFAMNRDSLTLCLTFPPPRIPDGAVNLAEVIGWSLMDREPGYEHCLVCDTWLEEPIKLFADLEDGKIKLSKDLNGDPGEPVIHQLVHPSKLDLFPLLVDNLFEKMLRTWRRTKLNTTMDRFTLYKNDVPGSYSKYKIGKQRVSIQKPNWDFEEWISLHMNSRSFRDEAIKRRLEGLSGRLRGTLGGEMKEDPINLRE